MLQKLERDHYYGEIGRILKSTGMIFEGYLPSARLGATVEIFSSNHPSVEAEVIGFRDKKALLMPLDDGRGINTSSLVRVLRNSPTLRVSPGLIGRVINGKGDPIDGLPLKGRDVVQIPIFRESTNPLAREMITQPLDLGIRAINSMLTCAQGQRIGIMAGSGVGKSTLLGMLARYAKADVNVIALIGERGREVGEFIENDLGPEGLKKSIIVAVTGDQSPVVRVRGAYVATAIAEYFSQGGANVLLMMDSLTRFCMAQREIGLSLGEPPASKGYTPSVFAALPKLLERAGNFKNAGSITGIYTVLVDGDDMDEPIADSSRAILDGHIVLSRNLANRGHYPPIEVTQSVSRCMSAVIPSSHKILARELKELMAVYQQNEDLINIGAYVRGNNQKLDQAVQVWDQIQKFLRQDVGDSTNIQMSVGHMEKILAAAGVRT